MSLAGAGRRYLDTTSTRWIDTWRASRRSHRDQRVRHTQDRLLRAKFDPTTERLIVFVVPGADPATGVETLSGGVLAICRISTEMERFRSVHESRVMVCTIPGETPFLRHALFDNSLDVYRLEQVFEYFPRIRSLTLHVPEYVSGLFASILGARHLARLREIENVHVNVMNQNVDLLPPPAALDELRSVSSLMTMTTAHQQYSTESLSTRYRMSLHHLAVPIGQEQYRARAYEEKEPLVLFSPDDPEMNREVMGLLENGDADLTTVEIRDLPHREYRRLLERARWTFTFGEGLDYYFVESVFSGGIALALYNDRFFTPEFVSLETVYPTYADLRGGLLEDLGRLSAPDAYARCQRKQLAVLTGMFSMERFRANLERFLLGDYTWHFRGGSTSSPEPSEPPARHQRHAGRP